MSFVYDVYHKGRSPNRQQAQFEILGQRLKSLGYASYRDYLKSNHWLRVRNTFWCEMGNQPCSVCFRNDTPRDLHHRDYRTLGVEQSSDLIALCKYCHSAVHDFCRSHPKINLGRAHLTMRRAIQRQLQVKAAAAAQTGTSRTPRHRARRRARCRAQHPKE